MEDARSLDELANDLATNHVLHYHAFDASRVHPIIQRGRAARSGQRRKPTTEGWRRFSDELAHQYVWPLRAPAKAALPHQLRAVTRVVRFQRRSEHLMKRRGATSIAAFRASADDDLEAA